MLKERDEYRRMNMSIIMNMNNGIYMKMKPNLTNDNEANRNQWEETKRSERDERDENVRYDNIKKRNKRNEINENYEKKVREDEDENKPDYEIYNFQDSGDGESWQLGNDTTTYANAYINGTDSCPEDIIVPRELKDMKGETRPVEVIGQWAYNYCGYHGYGKETKTVLVTKQVRIIKSYGFGNMWNVESFRIEEGSVLQSIEKYGLLSIGDYTGQNDATKRGTLTLPSTLSSVAEQGIRLCHLFKTIIYCGTHSLLNYSELYFGSGLEETKVKVIKKYPADTIFGQTPLYDSPTEVEVDKECQFIENRWNNKECNCSTPNKVISPVLALVSSLLYIGKESESEMLIYENREYESMNEYEKEDCEELAVIRVSVMKRMKGLRRMKLTKIL